MNRTLSQFADVAQGVVDSRRSATGAVGGVEAVTSAGSPSDTSGGQPTRPRAVGASWRHRTRRIRRPIRPIKLTRSTPERFRVQVRSPPCRLRAGRRRLGPSGTGDTSAAAARHSAVPKPSPASRSTAGSGPAGRHAMTTHHPIAPTWAEAAAPGAALRDPPDTFATGFSVGRDDILRPGDEKFHHSDGCHRWIPPKQDYDRCSRPSQIASARRLTSHQARSNRLHRAVRVEGVRGPHPAHSTPGQRPFPLRDRPVPILGVADEAVTVAPSTRPRPPTGSRTGEMAYASLGAIRRLGRLRVAGTIGRGSVWPGRSSRS